MKKVDFNTDAFWSAVKRKNMSELLVFAFTAGGEDEAAEVAKNTTRMTDAAITRIKEALGSPTKLDYADETEPDSNLTELIKQLENAIAKGKKKKAKKFYTALAEEGLSGSEMDKYKKAIKEL
jgi:hypothetical protein